MISNLKFELLSKENIEEILDAVYEVLEKTGANIHYDKAVELLAKNGCEVNGVHVKIPRELIKKCVETAPKGIQIYTRDGKESMNMTGRNVYFGAGPTCCNFYDPYTGERRKPRKEDAANTAKVCDALPNIDFAMSLCMIDDHAPVLADIHETDAMLRNTTKPLSVWAFNAENLDTILNMCGTVVGGMDKLAEKPFVIVYNEPTTPMVHTKEAMEKTFLTAKYNVPAIYTPGVTLGAAGPVTAAGCLTVGLADCLVGLVVSQLVNPGAPFVGGVGAAVMDMSTMQCCYGDPSDALVHTAANEVMHYLGLPIFDLAGCTDSKKVDAQAGMEGMLRVMSALMSGGHMVHDCGFMDMGLTGSLSMLTASNEMIGMAKRFCRGIEIDEDTIGLEYIDEAGPGGNFLQSLHTVQYFRTELFKPELVERRTYDAWEKDGALTYEDRAAKKVISILETHKVPELPADILAKLDEYVAKAEAKIKA